MTSKPPTVRFTEVEVLVNTGDDLYVGKVMLDAMAIIWEPGNNPNDEQLERSVLGYVEAFFDRG